VLIFVCTGKPGAHERRNVVASRGNQGILRKCSSGIVTPVKRLGHRAQREQVLWSLVLVSEQYSCIPHSSLPAFFLSPFGVFSLSNGIVER
jgi:hypothetical protein